ncbi:MAG: hypothetical protein C4294_12715, partial [Nitrospiraceae bacterium]
SIAHDALEAGLGKVLERIVAEVEAAGPSLVIVDSFRSVIRASQVHELNELPLQALVQRLSLHLTSWQATTFLVGEYQDSEKVDDPIFTVADGIVWLYQSVERNSIVRKLQVVKMRGQAPVPGMQTFRITNNGIQVFPRLPIPKDVSAEDLKKIGTGSKKIERVSTGVRKLDRMLGGGIPAGSSLLVAGPSGSGKTVLSMQFITEGIKQQEPGLLAVFEKRPSDYLKSSPLGEEAMRRIREGSLYVVYLRPLDLSLDETLQEVHDAVLAHGVKRVVIDSLSGLELALAPAFREDFRETLRHAHGHGDYPAVDGGAGRLLHRSAVQPARNSLSDRRHHHTALRRARRTAQTVDGGRQAAWQSTQQGAQTVRDHGRGPGHRGWVQGV